MIAVDTNVVVRFIVRDAPDEAARARALIETSTILLPITVLLETEWVLRSRLKFSRLDVVRALAAFRALPRVVVEEPVRVDRALTWAAQGMDLADALHLAASEEAQALATFDRSFRRKASEMDGPEVIAP